jgi:hypothetical protein
LVLTTGPVSSGQGRIHTQAGSSGCNNRGEDRPLLAQQTLWYYSGDVWGHIGNLGYVYQFFSVNQQINHTFKLQTQHLYSDSNHYNKIQSLHAVYNCFVPLSFSLLRGQASGQREKPHSIEGGLGGPGPQVSVPGNATKMERQII